MAGSKANDQATPGKEPPGSRKDAIERYWETIQAQMAFLEQIDAKSQRLVRYSALLVGIVLTAISFVPQTEAVGSADVTLLVEIDFVGGVSLLLGAVGLAAYASLDSVLRYGLGESFGYRVADGTVESPKYEQVVLNTYAAIVGRNRTVINVNARRFQHALLALLVGLVYVSLSGLLALISVGLAGKTLLWIVATVVAG